jgi:hypothetical protein
LVFFIVPFFSASHACVLGRYGGPEPESPAFVADGVHGNDAAILLEKPQHAGIELADMA